MILTPLQKLLSNVADLGKIIVATSFEWLPNVQKIPRSGYTVCGLCVILPKCLLRPIFDLTCLILTTLRGRLDFQISASSSDLLSLLDSSSSMASSLA